MGVIMRMPGVVSMRVRVICVALMRVVRCNAFAGHHIYFGSGEAATTHLAHFEPRAHVQRHSCLGKCVERNADIHEGAQQHVAANAGEALQISNAHRS
jgi:hypothetical protein